MTTERGGYVLFISFSSWRNGVIQCVHGLGTARSIGPLVRICIARADWFMDIPIVVC